MTLKIAGQTFGHLEAVEPSGEKNSRGVMLWWFRCVHCDCKFVRPATQVKSDWKNHRLPKCRCQYTPDTSRHKRRRKGIAGDYFSGVTITELSKKHGVSKQRIDQIVILEMDKGDVAEAIREATREQLNDAVLNALPKLWLFRLAESIKKGGSDGV